MSKTKFCSNWKETYSWVAPVFGDVYSATCILCKGKSFSISNRGISQVQQHATGAYHKKLEKDIMDPCTFKSKNGNVQTSREKIVLSDKEKILKAEIIQNLYLVDHNRSFSSANNDNSGFKRMLPDSDIPRGYSQSERKAKYMIQFGIAPCVFEKLTKDFSF